MLRANGDVAAQMTQVGGTAATPYTAVDDAPMDEADYTEDNVVGNENEYQYEDLASGRGGIVHVGKLAYLKSSDGGAVNVTNFMRSGGTKSSSATIAAPATSAYRMTSYPTDPATSAAWTRAAVNAATGGEEISA